MTERQPQVAKFNRHVQELLDAGLTDLKFLTGNTSESTMESFCAEANDIEEALQSENYTVHDWKSDGTFLCG